MNLRPANKSICHIKYFHVIIVLVISFSFFNSCSNPHKSYYLRCTSATVDKWLDTTINDSAHRIERLILQFYSPDIKHSDDNMEALIYPINEYGEYYGGYPDSLKKGTGKTFFSGPAIFGNNAITREKIIEAITDDSTHLRVSFAYLAFKPKIDTTNHIFYSIFPTDAAGDPIPLFQKTAPVSDPCPPAKCYK